MLAHRFSLSLPSSGYTVDIAQEILSVKKLANLEFDAICFGHGSPLVHKSRSTVISSADTLDSFSKSSK